jgi:signal transduction histidine kinase
LHDGLAQQLTAIGYLIGGIEEKLAAKSAPEAAEVARIARAVEQAVRQTHDLSRGLYPVVLTTQGIVPALRHLAGTIEEMFGLPCHFKSDPAIRIHDPNVARQLYRIAQEAATNAARHSRGSHIWIALRGSKNQVTLTVKDDGVGISESALAQSHMGIHILKHRAKAIGALLDISHAPQGGTKVACVLPNRANSPPAATPA